jgi:hypothetical protein
VPSALGWQFDLSTSRGPIFVVLRADSAAALEALRFHLVAAGAMASEADASELLTDTRPEPVEVVW